MEDSQDLKDVTELWLLTQVTDHYGEWSHEVREQLRNAYKMGRRVGQAEVKAQPQPKDVPERSAEEMEELERVLANIFKKHYGYWDDRYWDLARKVIAQLTPTATGQPAVDVVNCLSEIILMAENGEIFDEYAHDGDDIINTWKSSKFHSWINRAKNAINKAQGK